MELEENIKEILKKMSLQDKIALCSGASFWETKKYEKYGIPTLFMCDGPHGLRKQEGENGQDMLGVNQSRPATCFPAEVTTAGSWDPVLLEKIGTAIGEEAKEQGVGLLLGPGANIKRNPLCGRNFEYFSEDPYLTGKLAAGFIKGVQKQGIGTSLKHFAANSQEHLRFNSDSLMDERTLRELYLTGFEIAVKEGKPSTVMCAYPKLNGIHCSDNKALLTDILRDEWGFTGMVVTDWGAMNDRIEGFRAGCDLNMPGGSAYMEKEVYQAVRRGKLPEALIDSSAGRILKLVLQAKRTLQDTKKLPKKAKCDYEAHHQLARNAAEQGTVLLQNRDHILPLKKEDKIAVIGKMAERIRFQGAGSSHINPTKLSQPLKSLPYFVYAPGCDENGNTTPELLKEAKEAAEKADKVILFAGLPDHYESEGFDRTDMQMPEGHQNMIKAIAGANPNTIVVLLCGCVVECPWADQVKGILYMGLPGQAGGEAVSNLLYGKVNPSGKLTESWPYTYEDVPSSEIYGKTKDALYEEGIYTGYRYYEKAAKKVRWPFGYGLSYTSFSYCDLQICPKASGYVVTVSVKNTGDIPGAEVVQLYVNAPQDGIHRPIRELKGFQKLFLQPGEEKRVSFALTDRDFSIWLEGWKVPSGEYRICVGNLSCTIRKEGIMIPVPKWQQNTWYETFKGKPDQREWETMLGKSYTPEKLCKGHFTMDHSVKEMKEYSLIMKIMYYAVEKTVAKGFDGKVDYNNPDFRMLMASSAGSPLRSMQISGGMKGGLMKGLLEMANGHYLRGIKKMIFDL